MYRERGLVKAGGTPDKSIRFVAAPGEHVLLTGADRLTGWHRADAERHIYRVSWPHRFITWNQSMTHPDDEYHRIIGNGFATTAGAWGAQAGISLSSSPGCVIERNVVSGNREGFNFREQLRTTPTIEDRADHPVWNHDQLIRQNVMVYNRDAQVWGWFDVKDNRHWPATNGLPHQAASAGTSPPGDIAGASVTRTSDGQPQGLTLDSLRLRFEKNIYFARPGQGWFAWGP